MMSSVQFVSDDEDVNVDGGGRGKARLNLCLSRLTPSVCHQPTHIVPIALYSTHPKKTERTREQERDLIKLICTLSRICIKQRARKLIFQ